MNSTSTPFCVFSWSGLNSTCRRCISTMWFSPVTWPQSLVSSICLNPGLPGIKPCLFRCGHSHPSLYSMASPAWSPLLASVQRAHTWVKETEYHRKIGQTAVIMQRTSSDKHTDQQVTYTQTVTFSPFSLFPPHQPISSNPPSSLPLILSLHIP